MKAISVCVSHIVHAVQMEISVTFLHQTASVRLLPAWRNLHLTAKNTASDAETVAETCPPPSAALSVQRNDAVPLQKMARPDLRFFQNSLQNDGCSAFTFFFFFFTGI